MAPKGGRKADASGEWVRKTRARMDELWWAEVDATAEVPAEPTEAKTEEPDASVEQAASSSFEDRRRRFRDVVALKPSAFMSQRHTMVVAGRPVQVVALLP